MKLNRPQLDDSATFVGILLGIVIGALYALLHIKQKGSVRRKDLTQFGAGSAEVEMEASLEEAKRLAKARLNDKS
ncbi:MAG: YtxH domain-containing protein [Chloroflexi bacterium]|nr:YtxH domain-containing protein [Chloroflexota bacterium]